MVTKEVVRTAKEKKTLYKTLQIQNDFSEKETAAASLRFADLFAGLGGVRLGFEQAAGDAGVFSKCVFSSEIKPFAICAYKNHFCESEIKGDITKIPSSEIPDFDILLAGFPCQPFSFAGKGLGFSDTRGTLFFEIERILKEKIESKNPPKGFLLENVEGLVKHDKAQKSAPIGRTLATILERLETLGYKVSWRVLNAKDFGLAQDRKRIYIAGSLKNKIDLENFPKKTSLLKDVIERGQPAKNSPFIKNLLSHYSMEELCGKSIKDKRGGKNNIHSWDLELKGPVSKKQKNLLNAILKERRKKKWAEEIGIKWMDGMPLTAKQIATFFPDENLEEMLCDLAAKGYLSFEHPKKLEGGGRVLDTTKPKGYNIVTGKLSFEFSKILDPAGTAPTLVATDMQKLGVVDSGKIRRLTVSEGLKLFGYENYDLSMIKKSEAFDLLGNTVCVPVIKAVSKRLLEAI